MIGGEKKKPIFTNLTDPILERTEGERVAPAYDFHEYRRKVNRYIEEHSDILAIHKVTHNIPLSIGDYQELERILTSELGTKKDYQREFDDTPFGLLIRRVAKPDHERQCRHFLNLSTMPH